ncbi:hypothetical protein JW905_12595 [bacterium]|nr:hypothetical protein [candidate division CSSED10-310 bacterium]
MKWFDRMQQIDRRIIYLLVALVVALPLVLPLDLPTFYTPPVNALFNFIEGIKGDGVLLLGFNHDGSVVPEIEPMVRSVIRHAFLRDIKILAYCWSLEGATLGDSLLVELANQYGKVYGEDYVNFGYKIPSFPIIIGMGSDITRVLPTDSRGTPIGEIPMMKNIRSYENIDLIIDFSGSSTFYRWIYFAHTRFDVDVAAGVTGVIAAEAFPLLQTEQLIGLMAGLKDAAEYEQHADEVEAEVDKARGITTTRRANIAAAVRSREGDVASERLDREWDRVRDYDKRARKGMDSQAIAHILIIGFIVLGNIGYFAGLRDKKRTLRRH